MSGKEQGDSIITTFDELDLKESLLRGIYGYGFEKPSIIQQRGIIPILSKTDAIIQAQSGTGKTGTFTIACLQLLDESLAATQVLILAPTRELAQQIYNVATGIGSHLNVSIYSCIGGTDVRQAIDQLRAKPPQFVIGTPGRVSDMLQQKAINLENAKVFVLDEADEMLSSGFKEQIQQVFQHLPREVQVVLCSATMPSEILDLASKFMRDPKTVLVKREELTLDGIKQFWVPIENDRAKFDMLLDLYSRLTISQAIIFVNTRRRADELTSLLKDQDFSVSCLHGGEMSPKERGEVLDEFRRGNTRILIATDLIARGIDVQQVNIVINYEVPTNKENYLHRIGRSGRLGKKGTAINFVTKRDAPLLKEIQEHYQTQIEQLVEEDLENL